jgi:hypothetical protein
MKRMLNLALFALGVFLVLYIALVALVYFNQERLIYFPPRTLFQTPAELGRTYEDVWLSTSDGVRIHGWFIPATPSRGTVLSFHGNASNVSTCLDEAEVFGSMGVSVFLVDYRGYGLSEGVPGEQETYRDAEAAWRYLTETRDIPAEEIIIMGRSLGGGVASWLAHEHPPGGLILDSTFTSLPDVGAHHYSILPVRWLSRHHYPTIERLPDIQVPVLISHSRDDQTIPFSHAERLYAAANEPKTLLEVSGGHTGPLTMERYRAGLQTFVNSVLPPVPAEPMLSQSR